MPHKNRTDRTLVWLGLAAGLLAGIWVQRHRQAKRRAWQAAERRGSPGRALISGASSGIGAAFARRLACQGYDLVLVARRAERLNALANEIRAASPVEVEVLPADLDNPADLEYVQQRISELPDLAVLVNNAGFGSHGAFARMELEMELRMVRVHVLASLRLARAALPGMLALGRGAIINVSSLGGFIPMPDNVTYSATKAYLNTFSEALGLELEGSGVRVQALCPGMTRSEFHQAAGIDVSRLPQIAWMTAEEVVGESLRGLSENRAIVVPGLLNKLVYFLATNPLLTPLIRFGSRRAGRFMRPAAL